MKRKDKTASIVNHATKMVQSKEQGLKLCSGEREAISTGNEVGVMKEVASKQSRTKQQINNNTGSEKVTHTATNTTDTITTSITK